jgi:hypothetical protein
MNNARFISQLIYSYWFVPIPWSRKIRSLSIFHHTCTWIQFCYEDCCPIYQLVWFLFDNTAILCTSLNFALQYLEPYRWTSIRAFTNEREKAGNKWMIGSQQTLAWPAIIFSVKNRISSIRILVWLIEKYFLFNFLSSCSVTSLKLFIKLKGLIVASRQYNYRVCISMKRIKSICKTFWRRYSKQPWKWDFDNNKCTTKVVVWYWIHYNDFPPINPRQYESWECK